MRFGFLEALVDPGGGLRRIACRTRLLCGQARDEFGDVTQTVARTPTSTEARPSRAETIRTTGRAADRNVPMTVGDRVYTGDRSRVELQVAGRRLRSG